MFFLKEAFNLLFSASQHINLDEHPHHFIEIKEKELILTIWAKIKLLFKPELNFVERLWASLEVFKSLLTHPLFTLDSQPVSLLNILVGISLFLLSFKYARMLSNKVMLKLAKAAHLDKTSEEAVKKIFYYVIMMILTVLILDICHVPITIFTVVGGALAIGFGLGTQNISNDFVSGLIIMIERPFKIGDMIEIGDSIGIVQQIGTRCTFIHDQDNKNIIVPNSELLKNNIINWSCNGNMIKVASKIAVEFKTDVVKATEVIEKALLDHPDIVNEYYLPKTFLTEFNEKSLKFEVIFMISLNGPDKKEILHQLFSRILIDFTKNNIRPTEGKLISNEQVSESSNKEEDSGEKKES